MFSTTAQPTATPPASPVFDGGGIEFLAYSAKIVDYATQCSLQDYLHPPTGPTASTSGAVTRASSQAFELLAKPEVPTQKADIELYKIHQARWFEQDVLVRNLRAYIIAGLSKRILQSLFETDAALFAATGPDIFNAARRKHSTVTKTERETAFAAATAPANGTDIHVVLHRLAEMHRVHSLLGEPYAEQPKIRQLLGVVSTSPTFALLDNNFHLKFQDSTTQTYAGLADMAIAMYDNRPTSSDTAALAITPSLSNAVAAAMSTQEIRKSIAALNAQLKKAQPKVKLVCAHHPDSHSHTTLDCKNPTRKNPPKDRKSPAPFYKASAAIEDSDDDTH